MIEPMLNPGGAPGIGDPGRGPEAGRKLREGGDAGREADREGKEVEAV